MIHAIAVGKIGPAFGGASLTVRDVFTAHTISASVGDSSYAYETYKEAHYAVSRYYTN
jgi:hypothetical protein